MSEYASCINQAGKARWHLAQHEVIASIDEVSWMDHWLRSKSSSRALFGALGDDCAIAKWLQDLLSRTQSASGVRASNALIRILRRGEGETALLSTVQADNSLVERLCESCAAFAETPLSVVSATALAKVLATLLRGNIASWQSALPAFVNLAFALETDPSFLLADDYFCEVWRLFTATFCEESVRFVDPGKVNLNTGEGEVLSRLLRAAKCLCAESLLAVLRWEPTGKNV